MYFGRVLITAITRRWALMSAQAAVSAGGGASLSESGIECEVATTATPDGRPGYIILVGRRFKKEMAPGLMDQIRSNVLPVPTTAAFNAMPQDMTELFAEVGNSSVQIFGDGYEKIDEIYGRKMFVIPRMDGFFYIDTKIGFRRGVGGGNFLIMGESQESALLAAEAAMDAMKGIPYLRAPRRPAASGSKPGGKTYAGARATTNEKYDPGIVDRVADTRIPKDVHCVYEIIADGLTLDCVKDAMNVGIRAATTIPGVRKITAVNFDGVLGKINIGLHDILQKNVPVRT
jgi:formylmethanofuran--tetrahydromethanopterin N-formyltransferase